jgi:predicted ester cyclase
MLAQGDRVYVRWRQTGAHRGPIDGFPPTGRPLVEVASAVYRVRDGKIVEYWIQIDREGVRLQLERVRSGP